MAQKDVGNKIPIYKLKTTDEVMEFYNEWGGQDKYNKDMVDWNYTGPKETINTFKKYTHILTNNKFFAKNIKLYRSHGVDKERYKHIVNGHNFRLSNLLASIGFSQSNKIRAISKKKLKLYKFYKKYLYLLQLLRKDLSLIFGLRF